MIREKALFDVEKRKVEVELQRYAEEHNDAKHSENCYMLLEEQEKVLEYNSWKRFKPQGSVVFTSKQLVFDAIEAVGKERILKYIFGVESEGEE